MHLSNSDLNILRSVVTVWNVDATTHDGIDLYFHLQSIFIPRYMGCSSRQVFAHQGHSSVTSPLQALEDYSRVFLSSLIIDLQYWPRWK